ncbi:hypothetical protein NL676_029486 [Syzygium grande]|nr:hypothetical protein NL676_029486 [Syzygium grande]
MASDRGWSLAAAAAAAMRETGRRSGAEGRKERRGDGDIPVFHVIDEWLLVDHMKLRDIYDNGDKVSIAEKGNESAWELTTCL